MASNQRIPKWTVLRHFIPAAFTGKPIDGTGWVFHRVGIARLLVNFFLRSLSPRGACIYEINFLLLSSNKRIKEEDHPLYPGCKLTFFTAIVLYEPPT